MDRDRQSDTFDRRWVWLLGCLPALPILTYLALHAPPVDEPGVIHLTGDFIVVEEERAPLTAAELDAAGALKTVRIPGSFVRQGVKALDVWAIKRFTTPPELRGKDAMLFLPTLRTGIGEIYLNGHIIGRHGVAEVDWQQEQAGATHIFIGRDRLLPDENVLALNIHYEGLGIDGIVDNRVLIGPVTVVQPFVEREKSFRALMEHGFTVSLLMLMALLAFLHTMDQDRHRRDVYRSSMLLLGAVVFYLSAKTGVPWAWLFGRTNTGILLPLSIFTILLGTGEFIAAFTLEGRAKRLRLANRIICGGFIATLVIVFDGITVYRTFSLYIIVVEVVVLVVTARDLRRGGHELAPLVFVAIVIIFFVGLNDILTDLGVIATPRLFTLGGGNLAAFASVVAISEFVRIYRHNDELTSTLRERNEELADALLEATESARMKSEFLANTSHELRTPLNSIINIPQGLIDQYERVAAIQCGACGELFEPEEGEAIDASVSCPSCGEVGQLSATEALVGDDDPEETVRYLSAVVASGKHLLAVVNDILDFSKIEAGRMDLVLEPVDVGPLLDELEQTMGPLGTARQITLRITRGEGATELEADRVKLMQILVNLVSNAIKFSDEGGEVLVGAAVRDEQVVFTVTDHGIGIAPEDQARIFESFHQVESGHTRRFSGTGLGLAITSKLVDLHGGELSVSSTVGEGSTFTVALPRVRASFDAPPETDGAGDGRVAVLVVDDDPRALDTTRLALRPLGLQVRGVTRPDDVVERMLKEPPDLLILDVMMPRVSGVEILRTIRSHEALKELPVLVASAYSANEEVVHQLGARFLSKPWQAREMLAAAAELLKQSAERKQGRS